ncbi:thioredoxin family protein, partial [Candidatus Azambacteria bacterium]|nr:thioredoxin family protein [Candidatus Azambacteria bacterium]
MQQVLLEEVFSPGCHTCKELEALWETIKGDFPNVRFDRVDVTTDRGQELAQKYMIFASPGIIL